MFSGHAFFAKGRADDIKQILSLLNEHGIQTTRNPDLYERQYGQFTVDDARQLSERAALRAIGERRVFVLAVDSINIEAQNALLKTLEEPPGGALFVFLHPAPDTLLPTIRSRVQMLTLKERGSYRPSIDVSDFLKAKPAKRLDLLKPLLAKDEDEHRDFGEILAFLAELERQLKTSPAGLHAVYRARRYSLDRGALVKPLLEQLALLV